jgi:hypothetical protein
VSGGVGRWGPGARVSWEGMEPILGHRGGEGSPERVLHGGARQAKGSAGGGP